VLIRFFLVVRPWHPVAAGGLVAAAVTGAVLLAAGRIGGAAAMAPVVLLQTLVVSSGFAGPARRGHYDYLIASGQKRMAIALAHWAVSAAPGLAAWLLLAAIEMVTTGERVLLSPATVTTVLFASTLPWAVTVPLPRLTGGLVWVVLDRITVGTLPASLPTVVVAAVTAVAMASAIAWIQRADVPLETAQ
jgi:hypothetical protein